MRWAPIAFALLYLVGAWILYQRFRGSRAALIGGAGLLVAFLTDLAGASLNYLGAGGANWHNALNLLDAAGFCALLYALGTVPLGGTEAMTTTVPHQPTAVTRPTSVTVIGYALIVLAGIGLLVLIGMGIAIEFNRRFLPALAAMGVAVALQVGVGIALLQGRNWARWLYFFLLPLSLLLGLAVGRLSPTTIVQVVFYCIAVYYLTRPKAVAFFVQNSALSKEQDE